jgi:hypothetical protein
MIERPAACAAKNRIREAPSAPLSADERTMRAAENSKASRPWFALSEGAACSCEFKSARA